MDWLSILQTFGVSVSMLIFIAWSLIQLARWLAPRIDRLTERVFASADKVDGFESRIDKLEQQIETMWQFLFRRAQVEIIQKGIGTINSPLKISDEAKSWLAGLSEQLRIFYRKIGKGMSSTDLMVSIEKEFGERIVKEVCIPRGIFQGACLLIAMEIAREGDPDHKMDIPKDPASQNSVPQGDDGPTP